MALGAHALRLHPQTEQHAVFMAEFPARRQPPWQPVANAPVPDAIPPSAELIAVPAGVHHERLRPDRVGDVDLTVNPRSRLFHYTARNRKHTLALRGARDDRSPQVCMPGGN